MSHKAENWHVISQEQYLSNHHVLNICPWVVNELISFYLKGGDKKLILFDGYGIKWAKERESGAVVFTKSTLKKAVKYLL